MAELHFESVVNAPLARVWEIYLDVGRSLPALTPPEQQLQIESIAPLPPQLGTRVVMTAKTPIGRKKWVAEYVEFQPPHGTITGLEARFVDLQLEGPFKSWRHAHELEAIDDRTTRCIDHIIYEVGYGPFGWIGNALVVVPAMRKMFAHRERKLRELLG